MSRKKYYEGFQTAQVSFEIPRKTKTPGLAWNPQIFNAVTCRSSHQHMIPAVLKLGARELGEGGSAKGSANPFFPTMYECAEGKAEMF